MTKKTDEYCVGFEENLIPTIDELNLLEVMDLCSNLYLSHLLAVEILGCRSEQFTYRNDPVAESDPEGAWIASILFFAEQMFFKLKRIH